MTSLEIVPATPELVEAFFGKPPAFTFRGHAAVIDGEVLGLGGISYVGGRPVAFSDWKPELGRKDRARCFRFLERRLAEHKGRIFAICIGEQSRRLLERLGFRGPPEMMVRS